MRATAVLANVEDEPYIGIYQPAGDRCYACDRIYSPHEGTLLIQHRDIQSTGVVRRHGIDATITASDDQLLIAAARALKPIR